MVKGWLDSGEVDIPTLYAKVLTPAMNGMACEDAADICIWREHVRSSIVRTIVEMCYPYVIANAAKPKKQKVLIACPPGELHELGPRMVADLYTLLGFETRFAGANTPIGDILSAVKYEKPRFVVLSVTNHYNLIKARDMVEKLHGLKMDFEIIVGGHAFSNDPKMASKIGADHHADTFKQIKLLTGGGK